MMNRLASSFALTALLFVGTAQADIIAYDNKVTSPLQDFGGNLGLDFQVNTSIVVTELGAFNNGVLSNLNGQASGNLGVTVGIFDLSTGALMGTSAHITPTSSGSQVNGDFFVPVTSFTLDPGTYSIVAFNDDNYNSQSNGAQATLNSGGGLLTFLDSARFNSTASFQLPAAFGNPGSSGNFTPVPVFNAGTFQFNDGLSAVPEPSTFGMCSFIAGIFGAVWLYKRKRPAALAA